MNLRTAGRALTVIGVMLLAWGLHWSLAEELDRQELLVQLLVDGQVTELNELPGGDRVEVRARLYRLAKDSTCVPGLDGLCIYDYYLATGGDGPSARQLVTRVGELGNLHSLEWLEKRHDGLSVLRLETDARSAGPDPFTVELIIGEYAVGFYSPNPED